MKNIMSAMISGMVVGAMSIGYQMLNENKSKSKKKNSANSMSSK